MCSSFFAQFELEVTGERIRDKIAALRHKGMWMGEVVPLGYDLEDRHLAVNHKFSIENRPIHCDQLFGGIFASLAGITIG